MSDIEWDSEVPASALTSELIRTILESRRALRLAIALTQELMREGMILHWNADEQETAERAVVAPSVRKTVREHHDERLSRATAHRSRRHDWPRAELRLVAPDHIEAALVVPANAPFTSMMEATK